MLRRLLIGLLKGLAVGGAVGAALHFGAGATTITSWVNYLLYGAVGLLAGVVAGQPPWRPGAWVASILKGIFGAGLGVGLYALAVHFLRLPVDGVPGIESGAVLAQAPLLFAPAVATLYATLVELDDGGEQPAQESTGVRVSPKGASAELDEVGVERKSGGASSRAKR